jgi:hypothetical protein
MNITRMRLVLEAPNASGLTRTAGAKLYTASGESIPGIASITIGIDPQDIVKATVVLNNVVVEYAKPGEAP